MKRHRLYWLLASISVSTIACQTVDSIDQNWTYEICDDNAEPNCGENVIVEIEGM